jgi:hypothetical protein
LLHWSLDAILNSNETRDKHQVRERRAKHFTTNTAHEAALTNINNNAPS